MFTVNISIRNEIGSSFFDTDIGNLVVGSRVILETDRGADWGMVVSAPIKKRKNEKENARIFRLADKKDNEQINLLIKSSVYAKSKLIELVTKLGMDMKIMSVHYSFDASRVIVYFSAEGRVDYREILRTAPALLHTRIEFKQIGARDEVKMSGGIGICGQVCCCKRFLHSYPEVSVKMIKDHGVSMNSDKINGLCGRLKCCFSYEKKQDDKND
ncbi:MAG: hypothetical protein LBH47_03140 [Christensenellaceae bacterium]|jgi:cell fate regulator YaaT (PSP1 superfamily)|nr:hypothetical protein [Christensenellaceae bacterium]